MLELLGLGPVKLPQALSLFADDEDDQGDDRENDQDGHQIIVRGDVSKIHVPPIRLTV